MKFNSFDILKSFAVSAFVITNAVWHCGRGNSSR